MLKVIIIGCSTAGVSAAVKIKSVLGDNVEIIGYNKTSYLSMKAAGLPYYVARYYDDTNLMIAHTPEELATAGIKININCELINIRDKEQVVEIKNLETNQIFEDHYDKLIISVGAVPNRLSIPGDDASNIMLLNNLEDGKLMRSSLDNTIKKVIIVGGGYIGLELCEALRNNDKEVTLIESGAWLSHGYYDQEMSQLMCGHIERNGVKVFLNSEIKEIVKRKDNKIKSVILNNGTELNCDLLVETIGVSPNTDFLKKTGLKLNEINAIVVNKRGETNLKNVYAAGDCAMTFSRVTNKPVYSALATCAWKQGKVVGNNICGINDEYQGVLRATILKMFEANLARAGLTEVQAKEEKINYQVLNLSMNDYSSYFPGARPLTIKVIYDVDNDIMIGAQMYGYNRSVLRIELFISLIWNKTKLRDVAYLDLPYAPAFSQAIDIVNLILVKLGKK